MEEYEPVLMEMYDFEYAVESITITAVAFWDFCDFDAKNKLIFFHQVFFSQCSFWDFETLMKDT